MKINKIALLLFLFFLQFPVFSQFADLPIQYYKRYHNGHVFLNYKVFERKINKSFKHSKCFSNKDTTLRLLVIHNLYANDYITKKEYSDGSFLKKLHFHAWPYRTKGKVKRILPKVMVSSRATVNSKEGVVAFFSYYSGRFDCDEEYLRKWKPINYFVKMTDTTDYFLLSIQYNNEFMKYIWDKGNLFVFQESNSPSNTCYIINKQLEIYVFFEESDGQYNVLPIKEFVEKYWDRFSKKKGVGCTN